MVDSLRENNPEIVLIPWWDRSETSFAMDATKLPFDDIRVRRAMQMALDLEGINRNYYKGTAMWQLRIPVKRATHSGNKKPPGGWSNPDTATIAGWLF